MSWSVLPWSMSDIDDYTSARLHKHSSKSISVGIDATGIRSGGGLTHLMELLRAAKPTDCGVDRVIVWAGKSAAERMPVRPFLTVVHVPEQDAGLLRRMAWQSRVLPTLAKSSAIDVMFVPGGTTTSRFCPMVSMSQNMLPFQVRELLRYGLSWMTLRLLMLRWSQSRTAIRSDGYIFLTSFAKSTFEAAIGRPIRNTRIIPHGVDSRFRLAPRPQEPISTRTADRPWRLLYVSIVDVYKHQWQVARAVASLRSSGLPVTIDFVGPSYPPSMRLLRRVMRKHDPRSEFIAHLGPVPFEDLHRRYAESDGCVFASTCENLPIIMLEGMAAGLPIACSNRGPMPETLQDGGVYFDPEDARSIESALITLLADEGLRQRCASRAHALASHYTWDLAARQTFTFLAEIGRNARSKRDS